MKTVLICHGEDELNRIGMARWLNSFSELAGIVVIQEGREARWRRVRNQIRRSGLLRFADVLAFQVYFRLFLVGAVRRSEREILADLCRRFPPVPDKTPELIATTPNSEEVVRFISSVAPDVMVARCKFLLHEKVFTIPLTGTFALHPGICPEYRNAHGCFWALVQRDLGNVGLTLLKIDKGVDTGPVYGYYRYAFDEARESHIVIQHRAAFENLDAIAQKLGEIHQGLAPTIDTRGRKGAVWGQPWLTSYLKWKRAAHRK